MNDPLVHEPLSEYLFQVFASIIGAEFSDLRPEQIDSDNVERLLLRIRLAAVVALGRIGAPSSAAALVAGLKRDKNELSLRTLVEVGFLDGQQVDMTFFKKKTSVRGKGGTNG